MDTMDTNQTDTRVCVTRRSAPIRIDQQTPIHCRTQKQALNDNETNRARYVSYTLRRRGTRCGSPPFSLSLSLSLSLNTA